MGMEIERNSAYCAKELKENRLLCSQMNSVNLAILIKLENNNAGK